MLVGRAFGWSLFAIIRTIVVEGKQTSRIMKTSIGTVTVAALLAMNFTASVLAQPTTNTDPRSHALAEATVSLPGLMGVAAFNPAGIGGDEGVLRMSTNVGNRFVFATQWGLLPDLRVAGPSADYSFGRAAVALQARLFHLGTFERRDEQNVPVGDEAAYYLANDVGASYELSPGLRLGVAFTILTNKTFFASHGVALSLGAQKGWRFETGSLFLEPSAGLSLTDFGPAVGYGVQAVGAKEALETRVRGGGALAVRTKQEDFGGSVFVVRLAVGLTKDAKALADDRRYDTHPFRALFATWKPRSVWLNVNDPTDVKRVGAWGQLTKSVGMEAAVFEVVYLRFGKVVWPQYSSQDGYQTFGLGFDLRYIVIDYFRIADESAFLPGKSMWKVTGRIPLRRKVK